ncbi:MAG: DNA gyrase inhibitor YacG [Asticcacaulis sp. 32-58-5]|nr:MAG: DNA gyrase inhibitor YacG [Asticcacaulis sp. 32-58-5]
MATRTCARCRQAYETPDEALPNAARDYTPFCSKRCADVDLIHWLQGDYVIDGSGGLSVDDSEDGGASSGDLSSSFEDDDGV